MAGQMFQILYVVVRTLHLKAKPLCAVLAFTIAFCGLAQPSLARSATDYKTWLDLEHRGSSALDANEYWLAEPLLKKAMAHADKFDPKDMCLADSLGELGRLYTIRGRYDEAEAFLEEELSVKRIICEN